MNQYLTEVKAQIKNIIAVGSVIDIENIILYTLNGLSSRFQAFKIAIWTSFSPISLEYMYYFLISEEINIVCELAKDMKASQSHNIMYMQKSNKHMYGGKYRNNREKN